MKISYYYGYIVEFDKVNVYAISPHKIVFGKVNVYAISPHKIVFGKYGYNLLVLHYNDYHANENLFFIPEGKEPYTVGSLKRYIKKYFSMIYKMNLK